MTVKDLWAALEADSRDARPGFLVRRIPGDRELHLAIDKPSNRRMLMLEVSTTDLPAGLAALPGSPGFSIETVPEAQTRRISIHLVMGLPTFGEMFVVLVEDIVGRIVRAGSDRAAAKALFERLLRWQEFLRVHGPAGMPDEAQRGLFGELWFLRCELIPAVGEIVAINAWAGPLGSPQDFQMAGRAIEVKVSTTKQLQQLRIANERQLDDAACGKLLLFHLSLDARDAGAATLPWLVQALREMVATGSEAGTVFEDRLLASGYHDVHGDRYSRTSYTQRERNYFLVRDGFPRITEQMLTTGTGDVSYSIAVSACMPFRIADTDARQIIAGPNEQQRA